MKKKVCCIGAGYVGGPTIAVFADKCPYVDFTVLDINEDKIKQWNGPTDKLPIYEPGLQEIIEKNRGKNLFFSTDIDKAINESEIIFIAVNTPTIESGEGAGFKANLKYIEDCARQISKIAKKDKIIVEKSTVPIKTAQRLKEIFEEENNKVHFEVLSNPEFLAEGTAIDDLINPDRVLIGGNNSKKGKDAIRKLSSLYENWIPKEKILETNIWSSELSKLASNAMLAQRISSINSLSAICDKTGADILEVSKAISYDNRIGSKFLNPSVGFGGSCFQKDILNLVYLCRSFGLNEVADYWHQVVKINDYQKLRFINKVKESLSNKFEDKQVTLFGWSFKKDTNDSRESASIKVAYELLKLGISIKVYDPASSLKIVHRDLTIISNNSKEILKKINFVNDPYKAAKNSSCIGILTEWDEFKTLNWNIIIKNMTSPKLVIDGRYITKENKTKNFIYL